MKDGDYKDPTCRDCIAVSSGDCGKHDASPTLSMDVSDVADTKEKFGQ